MVLAIIQSSLHLQGKRHLAIAGRRFQDLDQGGHVAKSWCSDRVESSLAEEYEGSILTEALAHAKIRSETRWWRS